MKTTKLFIALLAFSSVFLFACQSETPAEEVVQVQLASEDAEPMPLQATFASDSGNFAYQIAYDGNYASLVAGQLDGASVNGAGFKLDGSAEIITTTGYLDSLEFADVQTQLEVINGREFYRYAKTDEKCHYEYAGTVYDRNEGLVFQMRACDGEDREVGEYVLKQMLSGLSFEELSKE